MELSLLYMNTVSGCLSAGNKHPATNSEYYKIQSLGKELRNMASEGIFRAHMRFIFARILRVFSLRHASFHFIFINEKQKTPQF